ncbi:NAD(P)-dependent oxidoreductase [Tsuneonella suprasediminis]|uniref:NAD(P)-dependent oxidoreductase n=1 Tax=Tsuneonella suprasediminis TaxID=2306996 RepID=A0A419QXV9_9SPHN|nr:NAD(P)-dependent oxidoreductase [Tsuneonella suprasediminis]RJX65459.1 NAD(P)-dependent oxidoreductase [Tsuneonella suprasediminis]
MHVLLTGSSGWLGRFLAPMLAEEGHDVTGFDIAPGEYTGIVGSVSDRSMVDRAFSNADIDAVIHAGGLHQPDLARCPSSAFVDTNVQGTLNMLEASRAAGVDRFVFTSTTSLMACEAVHSGTSSRAVWFDESYAPLEPRNVYGVTKLAAEQLCRLHSLQHRMNCIVLRPGRFFPGEDSAQPDLSADNHKANEFLNCRLMVDDVARAHVLALERAPALGFDTFILSAPTPFVRDDTNDLKRNAKAVIGRLFPEAARLFARRGRQLPASISRVYDSSHSQSVLGLRYDTRFSDILTALREGEDLPFATDRSPGCEQNPDLQRMEKDL